MLLVGLTGGIGSGKSTVASMLEQRGAVVFDADIFARHAIESGTPGHPRVVEEFGPEVLTEEGQIDREALAAKVFRDPEARRRLEAIVHPEVARQLREALVPYRDTNRIVVYSVPLLVEAGLESAFDAIVVVAASEEVRVERLASHRGMSEDAARSRIRAQVSDPEREAVADFVIRNDGSLRDLEREVVKVWEALRSRTTTDPD